MQQEIFSRPEPVRIPEFPLPLYVRSMGHNILKCGDLRRARPGREKPFVQIFWCVRGEGAFKIDGKKFRLGAGQACYHLPGEPHIHLCAVEPWEYWWITFDGPSARDFMAGYRYPRHLTDAGAPPEELLLELRLGFQDFTPDGQRRQLIALTSLLARLGAPRTEEDQEQSLLRRFRAIIEEGFDDPELNVNSIADDLGIHRFTLSRFCREFMHMTPGRYLKLFRMQKALALLHGSERPIHEVALACGMPGRGRFASAVREATGTSPQEYRRLNRRSP